MTMDAPDTLPPSLDIRGIGDNLKDLTSKLERDNEELLTDADKARAAFADVPKEIKTEADYDIALRVSKGAADLLKKVEDRRKTVKQPFLDAGRDVDGFFNGDRLAGELGRLNTNLRKDIGVYLADQERIRREAAEKQAEETRLAAEQAAAKAAEAEGTGQTRVADAAFESAVNLEQQAVKHENIANRSATDMSRTVTGAGSGSVRKVWKHKDVDRDKLDLEALRPFFPDAALDDAIRAFIKAGRRTLKGVEIYEDIVTTIR